MASSTSDPEPVQIIYDDDFREPTAKNPSSDPEDQDEQFLDQEQQGASDISTANGSVSSYKIPGKIDVSDPNQIIELLENVDLTEEDTEILLQDAYKMNRKLKEMLRRQEEAAAKGEGKGRRSNQSRKSGSNSSSTSGSRTGSAFSSQKAPLPPITVGSNPHTSDIYSVKLKRSTTNISVAKKPVDTPLRSHSTKNASRREEKAPQQRKSKARGSEPRPEWNDRFNYT